MDGTNSGKAPSGHPGDSLTVPEAVAAFQRGKDKEKNFQLLVERFYGPVLRFLSRWAPEQDCLDLAQEVFLRVYKNLHGYRGEAQVSTWVFTIAYNTCMGQLACSDPEASALPIDELDEDALATVDPHSDDPLEKLLVKEQSELVRKAIAALPEKERRCLELRVYGELPYHEIATTVGPLPLSIGTVKAHLFHARARLRARLRSADR